VLARLGQPAEPAIQQAGHLHIVQDLLKPGQLHKLVLVAAARPTTIQPQQVTQIVATDRLVEGVASGPWREQLRARTSTQHKPTKVALAVVPTSVVDEDRHRGQAVE
jgi:hypothetical protein